MVLMAMTNTADFVAVSASIGMHLVGYVVSAVLILIGMLLFWH